MATDAGFRSVNLSWGLCFVRGWRGISIPGEVVLDGEGDRDRSLDFDSWSSIFSEETGDESSFTKCCNNYYIKVY